jgi:type IV secretion system protein VirD4
LRRRPVSHGSARWATLFELIRGGVWARSAGLIVAAAHGAFIRYRGEGAVLAYAPMGSGKGVGLVIPNLLDYRGAVICTDPKGENLAVTGRWRSTMGPVYRLDTQHPDGSHCFNPFDMVRVGTHHEADDIAALADLLVTPESLESHWDTSARQLICMLIGYIIKAKPPALWTLSTVRHLVALGGEAFEYELEQMAICGNSLVEEEARVTLAGIQHDETRSVIKNTAKALQFWSRDRIGGKLTSRSDFSFLDMHSTPMTVYVVVPEDKLKIYQPFLRLMMGCALAAAVRGKEFPVPKYKPLLLVDEFAALGRVEALEAGIGYLRAYARVMLILQDLGQLRRIYGHDSAASFVAASGCQVTFNINDNDTAQLVTSAIGNTTVFSRSIGASQPSGTFLHQHFQAGHSESGRPLHDVSEVRRLPHRRCLVFTPTAVRFPIYARKVRYYKVRRWRGRWDGWRS